MAKPRRRAVPYPPSVYPQAPAPIPVAYPYPQQLDTSAIPPVVSVQSLSAKNATVAKVAVTKNPYEVAGPTYKFEAADSAKREQGDRYDPVAGELLSLGRAFQDLGQQMVSAGNERVSNVVEQQLEERRRALQRRLAKAEPPRRRTREEWEAMQEARAIFENGKDELHLGLADMPSNLRIQLAGDRYAVVEDDALAIHRANGDVMMRIPRS